MSPMLKYDEFHKKTPLVRTIDSAIHLARNQKKYDQELNLYVHRFSVKHRPWLDEEEAYTYEQNLIKLLINYVYYLPELLDNFFEHCRSLNWHNLGEKTESILTNFFDGVETKVRINGLIGMLDKIYFSHRLVEELHDFMMCKVANPLLTWDMTMSNLIVHELMGHRYSSHLDQTVIELSQKLVEGLLESPKTGQSQKVHWPCFCERFNVGF